jgi:hypothetical protein
MARASEPLGDAIGYNSVGEDLDQPFDRHVLGGQRLLLRAQ